MNKQDLTPSQIRIIDAMDKVCEKLIAYKKKVNSELVVIKNNKIVRIKP